VWGKAAAAARRSRNFRILFAVEPVIRGGQIGSRMCI
jgi:hypothetical protein